MNKKTLYLDQDGVVADWVDEAKRYLNRHWVLGEYVDAREWSRLKEHTRFYRHLPLMRGAKELVEWARHYTKKHNMNLAFLTAIPASNDVPYAIYDKILWSQERFPDIPVFFGPYAEDKHIHCLPGDILIDDKPSNCVEWRLAGGIACQYTSWDNCKIWIEHHLEQ